MRVFAKRKAVGIALVLLVFIIGLIGCSESSCSVCGLYVAQEDPQSYLQLNSDGTFVAALGFHGSWQVEGNEIRLITVLGLFTGRIEGDKIILPNLIWDGETIWVKKGG